MTAATCNTFLPSNVLIYGEASKKCKFMITVCENDNELFGSITGGEFPN
jgi:hypothetical protein